MADSNNAKEKCLKYGPEVEAQVKTVISGMSGEPVDDLMGDLKDGVILCKAMNAVVPNSIKKINESSAQIKHLENIASFLAACSSDLQMSEEDLFTAQDLFEGKNSKSVVHCLVVFSKAASSVGYDGPTVQA